MIGVAIRRLGMEGMLKQSSGGGAVFDLSDAKDERACVDAVLKGDHEAFRTLVEEHQTRVYNLAYRMLGNEKEAEDAAQDAFAQAYARLRSYNAEWRFKTWIMTITSNLCIDRLRRRKIEPLSFADYTAGAGGDCESEADPIETRFVSGEPGPEAVFDKRQRQTVLNAMLRELPEEDRGMVVMFYWDDMSYDDIAKATRTSVSAVKSRLFRARQKMAASTLAAQVRA
jgi:RNA polymerase sigma-70 factor, ECF subfamily